MDSPGSGAELAGKGGPVGAAGAGVGNPAAPGVGAIGAGVVITAMIGVLPQT